MLAAVNKYLGNLDRVINVVKIQAFVNSKARFTQQHIVVNAASQLLYDLFAMQDVMLARQLVQTSFHWILL